MRENKLGQAQEQFRRAAQLDPNDTESRFQLASLALRQRKLDEADAALGELFKLAPNDARAYLQLGVIQQMRGDPRNAMATYRKSIEADPHSPAANNLAWLLATSEDATLRDGAEAVRLAEGLRKSTSGERPDVLDTLAAAYAEAGDFGKAVQTAETGAQLAVEMKNSQLEAAVRSRLVFYQQRKPYREPATQPATQPRGG